MLEPDPGWNVASPLTTETAQPSADQQLAQRLDALDHAVSRASRRLAQLMSELDLDAATGVLTAPAFRRALVQLCADTAADPRPHALLHVWVPDLGVIALAHGAASASVLLAHLAHLLQSLLRDDDPVGRLAEDELAAAMVHAAPDVAWQRLRLLEERAASGRFLHGGAAIPFRLLGAVVPLTPANTISETLHQAAEQTRARRAAGDSRLPDGVEEAAPARHKGDGPTRDGTP